jgi:uncharacterized protein YsxB (DUF464 family)
VDRLETFAASSAISNYRASGHSNVGHHDINAVPFGVSVSIDVPVDTIDARTTASNRI